MAEGPRPTWKYGNVTRTPKLAYGKNGRAWTKFGLAWKPYTRKDEPEQETVFYEVVCFGDMAENVCETLMKGDRALVIGKDEVKTWEGQNGTQTTNEIMADAVGPDLRFKPAQIVRNQALSHVNEARQALTKAEPAEPPPWSDDEEPF